MRINAYIDGFNLYHSILKLNDNSLKWLNLRSLCEKFLKPTDTLNEIYFFTAPATHIQEKLARHYNYTKALKTEKITIIQGKFKKKFPKCKNCATQYLTYEEKQSDINLAIHLLKDAYCDKFDTAFLVTADTDFVSAVKMVKNLFPQKKIILLVPPKRVNLAHELTNSVDFYFEIKKSHLKNSLLPDEIYLSNKIIKKPSIYN